MIQSSFTNIERSLWRAAALSIYAVGSARGQQPTSPTPPLVNTDPVVSPDGRRIAFVSNRDGVASVYVMDADGSNVRRLVAQPSESPQWSLDGTSVRFAGTGADSGSVFIAAATGGTPQRVAKLPGRAPRLSPDGQLAVYLSGSWTATAMNVARTDGSLSRRVAGGSTTAWNGAWSNDGKLIAYTWGDSTRNLQLHVVAPDGTGDRAVTQMSLDDGRPQVPAWSSDGTRLAFQAANSTTHIGNIWVVELAGGRIRKLAPHEAAYLDEIPSWFPDGSRIAFQSNRTGHWEIWVMNADGSDARQLTSVGASSTTNGPPAAPDK